MPIPDLDPEGFLPVGIHDATLDEVRGRFGQFQETDRRPALLASLMAYLADVRGAGIAEAVILDGSFVTAKASPGDIDLILVLRPGLRPEGDLRPDQYNVVSARRVKQRYPFDLRVATPEPAVLNPWVGFFSQVRNRPDRSKRMVRVGL